MTKYLNCVKFEPPALGHTAAETTKNDHQLALIFVYINMVFKSAVTDAILHIYILCLILPIYILCPCYLLILSINREIAACSVIVCHN
jgi:hypothetical protein